MEIGFTTNVPVDAITALRAEPESNVGKGWRIRMQRRSHPVFPVDRRTLRVYRGVDERQMTPERDAFLAALPEGRGVSTVRKIMHNERAGRPLDPEAGERAKLLAGDAVYDRERIATLFACTSNDDGMGRDRRRHQRDGDRR